MKAIRMFLGALQIFIAVMAIPAAGLMILTPDGSGVGIPLESLARSPFADFLIPGLVLFFCLGLGNVAGAILSIKSSEQLGIVGLGLGIMLIAWIGVQVYFMGWLFFLQPLFLGIGVIEMLLSLIYHLKLRIAHS